MLLGQGYLFFRLSFKLRAVHSPTPTSLPKSHVVLFVVVFVLFVMNPRWVGRRRERHSSKDRQPRRHPLLLLSLCMFVKKEN